MALSVHNAFDLLKQSHERGRLAHAYLVTGSPHSGKEEFVSLLIEHLNKNKQEEVMDLWGDVLEDSASESSPIPLKELVGEYVYLIQPQSKSRMIRVDSMRELQHKLQLSAPPNQVKIGIIKDADRLNEMAMNAFLKTLEEPPDQSLIILMTAHPERLLETIRSRCITIPLLSSDKTVLLEQQDRLEEDWNHALSAPAGFTRALAAKASVMNFLEAKKKEVISTYETAYKEEVFTYKKRAEGDWLKEQEAYYKGLAESEILADRELLIDWIINWLGDALRQKEGQTQHLSCPNSADITQRWAQQESWDSLLQRIDALLEMRSYLGTNAHEALVLETGFLKAFV